MPQAMSGWEEGIAALEGMSVAALLERRECVAGQLARVRRDLQHVYLYVYIHIYTYIRICTFKCMYVCIFTNMYIQVRRELEEARREHAVVEERMAGVAASLARMCLCM